MRYFRLYYCGQIIHIVFQEKWVKEHRSISFYHTLVHLADERRSGSARLPDKNEHVGHAGASKGGE